MQDPKIGREILPIPDQAYQGYTPVDARDAAAPRQSMLHASEGSPNVVIVLVDDMGFGIPSAFGGCVNMPTTDRLAESGLRYNQFHTTALCSPTRQALLTGRNHHSSGFGSINGICDQLAGQQRNATEYLRNYRRNLEIEWLQHSRIWENAPDSTLGNQHLGAIRSVAGG